MSTIKENIDANLSIPGQNGRLYC